MDEVCPSKADKGSREEEELNEKEGAVCFRYQQDGSLKHLTPHHIPNDTRMSCHHWIWGHAPTSLSGSRSHPDSTWVLIINATVFYTLVLNITVNWVLILISASRNNYISRDKGNRWTSHNLPTQSSKEEQSSYLSKKKAQVILCFSLPTPGNMVLRVYHSKTSAFARADREWAPSIFLMTPYHSGPTASHQKLSRNIKTLLNIFQTSSRDVLGF